MSEQQQSIHDQYPPIMVRPVPFCLPRAFLHQLGYARAVARFGPVPVHNDCQPRRFVALWWDPEAEQLGWSDGLRRGVGQLNRQVWLGWLHGGRALGEVGAWLYEHKVRLEDDGSAPEQGSGHWLIVDGAENRAWAVVQGLARKMVRRQQLEPTDAEFAESGQLANDPTLAKLHL